MFGPSNSFWQRSFFTQGLRIGTTAFLIFLSFGCGSSKSSVVKSNSNELTSRIPDADLDANPNALIADCNGAKNESMGLEIQLSSYYIPGSNQIASDLIRMHMSQIPSQIVNSDSYYLQLFRWYEDVPGQRNLNSKPVEFYFQSKVTGKLINESKPQDKISKAVIQNMIVEAKALGSGSGITLSNFFQAHIVLLTGIELQYDALTLALYNAEQGSAATSWQEILIPSFYANPTTYASTHPSSALQQLHPNWPYQQSGWSEQDYFSQTEKFCQSFL